MTRFSISSQTLCQRIESPAMQGMAAEQAPDGPGNSSNHAKMFYGVKCVLRACRSKPTGRTQPGRRNQLICPDSLQCQRSADHSIHVTTPKRASNSDLNSPNCCSFADRRGFMTKSNPLGICVREVLRISLTLLLIRFLSWAFPSLRGVVRPKRL